MFKDAGDTQEIKWLLPPYTMRMAKYDLLFELLGEKVYSERKSSFLISGLRRKDKIKGIA